jgi:hypothetical protein
MAKRKAAGDGKKGRKGPAGQPAAAEQTIERPKKGGKTKPPRPHKSPADPFGEQLPNYQQGSPADGNWKPTGEAETDLATLEQQERYLYRLMMLRKAERDLAKSQAKLVLAQAEQTSVTDGFKVEDKRRLHQQADASERKAAKAEKEWKRAKEGWHACNGMIHRYLTDDPRPLFDRGGKDKKAA